MGKTQDVKPTTLSALARGLKVPEEEIFAIAYGKIKAGDLTSDELRLIGYYRDIVPERRPDVLAHVELMNQMHGQTNDIKQDEVKSGKAMRRELKGKKQNNKK
jgi:hypothetical protein